ncbi:MAG TPA: YfiR family protein, partial [Terriglobia bacterium]|nr:YfiR family protein [Terriglobia bacterium]
VPQAASTEDEVKAAFLFNFAKFVDWPMQSFPGSDSPFTICVAGNAFDGALERIVQGETLDRRPLVVRPVPTGTDVRGCQILYIAPSEARRVPDLITAAGNNPVLTVGETGDFIEDGGTIRFVNAGGRIHFQINPDAAERASLKVSSRLLRLAEVVRPRRRAGVAR